MKTYVLMLAKNFPAKHPGRETRPGSVKSFFPEKNGTPSALTFRFGRNESGRCSKVKRLSPSVSGKAVLISADK